MGASACLPDDAVLDYASGRLGREAAAAVEEHLATCESCCALVAETAKWLAERNEHPTAIQTAIETETDPWTRDALAEDAPAPSVAPGVVVGRYRIVRPLGRGGMSLVYEARDTELRRRVAIKLLRPDFSARRGRGESKARILREARAMAKVSDPHVVTIYDVGEWEDEVFIAMELVEGPTLRAWMKERRPWRAVADVFAMAARGLAAAHANGLVHRDFKPANVLLGTDGRARVTDFGLARAAFATEPRPALRRTEPDDVRPRAATIPTLTDSAGLLGTPAYMAPEQFTGDATDGRTDQFAFCVALHEALYGVRPFEGEGAAAIEARVLTGDVRPPPERSDVPPALRDVVLRGLRVDPRERFASMADLLVALEAATRRGTTRRRVFAGAGLSVATATLVVVAWTASREPPGTAEPATIRAPDPPVQALQAPPPPPSLSSSLSAPLPSAAAVPTTSAPIKTRRSTKKIVRPSGTGARPIGDGIEDPF